jgi:hypothetical protein
MTLDNFYAAVLAAYPMAHFVTEDGSGLTYGEPGDVVAYVGAMRDDEDVVATLQATTGFAQILRAGDFQPL